MKKIENILIQYPLLSFFIMTYSFSWICFICSGVLDADYVFRYEIQWLISQIGVFGPSLVAIFISMNSKKIKKSYSIRTLSLIFIPAFILAIYIVLFIKKDVFYSNILFNLLIVGFALWILYYFFKSSIGPLIKRKKISAKWLIVSFFLLPGIFVLIWTLITPEGNEQSISLFKGQFPFDLKTILLVFSVNLIYGGSLGEELGWRGFALPRLLRRYNPLYSGFLLGIAWGLFHLPIDLAGKFAYSGIIAVVIRMVFSVPLSVIFTWLYVRTGGRLFFMIALHTSVNITGDLGFSDYMGTMRFFTISLIIISFLLIFSDKMWKKIPDSILKSFESL